MNGKRSESFCPFRLLHFLWQGNTGTDVRGDDPCCLAPPSRPNPAPCARIRVSGVFDAHAEICGAADDSGEIAVLEGYYTFTFGFYPNRDAFENKNSLNPIFCDIYLDDHVETHIWCRWSWVFPRLHWVGSGRSGCGAERSRRRTGTAPQRGCRSASVCGPLDRRCLQPEECHTWLQEQRL